MNFHLCSMFFYRLKEKKINFDGRLIIKTRYKDYIQIEKGLDEIK